MMLRSQSCSLILCGFGACVIMSSAGCGKGGATPTAEVTGTIKIAGKAPKLTKLEIAFLGSDNQVMTAVVTPEGAYTAPAVPVGEVKVGFIYVSAQVAAKAAGGKSRLPRPGDKGPPTAEPKRPANPIPQPLRDVGTSRLTCKVEEGKKNIFNYDFPAAP